MFAVCYLLFVVCHERGCVFVSCIVCKFVVRCLLCVVHCSLLVACCLMYVVGCLLSAVRSLLSFS